MVACSGPRELFVRHEDQITFFHVSALIQNQRGPMREAVATRACRSYSRLSGLVSTATLFFKVAASRQRLCNPDRGENDHQLAADLEYAYRTTDRPGSSS